MKNEEIKNLLELQRDYFDSGITLDVKFRVKMLKKLYNAIKKYETQIRGFGKKRI